MQVHVYMYYLFVCVCMSISVSIFYIPFYQENLLDKRVEYSPLVQENRVQSQVTLYQRL